MQRNAGRFLRVLCEVGVFCEFCVRFSAKQKTHRKRPGGPNVAGGRFHQQTRLLGFLQRTVYECSPPESRSKRASVDVQRRSRESAGRSQGAAEEVSVARTGALGGVLRGVGPEAEVFSPRRNEHGRFPGCVAHPLCDTIVLYETI